MKTTSILILLTALVGTLILTNPKLTDFELFIKQQVKEEAQKEHNPMPAVLGTLIGGIASRLLTQQTTRQDYVICCTYDITLGDEHMKVIGLLNNFFIIERFGKK